MQSVGDVVLAGGYRSVKDVDFENPGLNLVMLDLRLDDGSSPASNVAQILARGVPVLLYSEGDDPVAIREAVTAGAMGLVRKGDSANALLEAMLSAAGGDFTLSFDLAAIMDSDETLVDAGLSDREQQVLSLYAAGASAQQVASALGLSRHSIAEYVRRIRSKYRRAGRPALTRVDLFERAREDSLLRENP